MMRRISIIAETNNREQYDKLHDKMIKILEKHCADYSMMSDITKGDD